MMKKALLSLIVAGAMVAGANAKTLVVYFSATGNTRRLAQTAAQALGADIAEIVPKVPYSTADLDGYDPKSRSARANATTRPHGRSLPGRWTRAAMMRLFWRFRFGGTTRPKSSGHSWRVAASQEKKSSPSARRAEQDLNAPSRTSGDLPRMPTGGTARTFLRPPPPPK